MAFPSTRQSSLAASAPAWEAIARGDDKALAQSDFDASATRGGDQTMLHYACEHDSHTCAQWILDQPGVDANMQDAQLRTPFLLACENRALKTVGVLMAHKDVDLKAVNKQEQGALHMLASSDEAVATIGALLDKGLDASAISSDALTPLHVAVAHDAVGVARLLLDRGCAEWGTGAGKRAQPLLPIALAKNSAACAALLIERCAPLGGADTEGRTVVHLAVKMGAPCLPAILQRKGELDLDARDRAGRAALHYAVATGSAERAALLLEHGAAIDAEDGAGMTPLHVACCTGEPELAAQLVAKGARVDAADGAGNTPLHWACQRGSEACAKLLLANNANADCPNEAGLTPLVLATSAAMACIFADIESDAEAGGGRSSGSGSPLTRRAARPPASTPSSRPSTGAALRRWPLSSRLRALSTTGPASRWARRPSSKSSVRFSAVPVRASPSPRVTTRPARSPPPSRGA